MRRVPFEKIENFRDVGGYAARYGETSFGVIYRSGSLSDATESDLDKMASIGIKTIIDLRDEKAKTNTPDKSASDPRFKTVSLNVNGNGRVPLSRADQVDSYIEMLEDPSQARPIFLAIAHEDKPLVIHCTAGKDRTGCFIALLELANGVPFHDVNADYLLSFPYLTRLRRVTRKEYPDFPDAVLSPSVSFLKRVIARFNKKWGSVDEYLKSIGISDDDISLLDNLLGKQEKSCGAVIFNGGKILVEHMHKGHYSLPKGHVEKFDKDYVATAKREIKEETSLDVEIIDPSTNYHIEYSPKEGVAKKVVFFLATSEKTETIPQLEEVSQCYWLSANDAIRTLSHDSDKTIAKWAYDMMHKKNLL